jgi:hypothetical protein
MRNDEYAAPMKHREHLTLVLCEPHEPKNERCTLDICEPSKWVCAWQPGLVRRHRNEVGMYPSALNKLCFVLAVVLKAHNISEMTVISDNNEMTW